MKRKLMKFALLAGGLVASASTWATGPTAAAMLSNTCGGCHGTNGASAGPSMPIIGGQAPGYIEETMKKFKSGERPSSIMGRLAKAYSDDDFKAMDQFFTEKKFIRNKQVTDAAKVAHGKKLHEDNCKKCHLEGGRESEEGGILAGQWKEYLQINMNDFHAKTRPMPKKMAEKFEGLSKDELDALANYYASQQ